MLWRLHADVNEESGTVEAISLRNSRRLLRDTRYLMVRAKRRVARAIKSGALMADSKQTELCTYLPPTGGLLLNALVGWW